MTTDRVTALLQEVRDDLAISSVGLYEFIWILRSENPESDWNTMVTEATEALEILLSAGDLQLVRLIWPSETVVGELSFEHLTEADWEDPQANIPYVALMHK
jgi:hypothetical protein